MSGFALVIALILLIGLCFCAYCIDDYQRMIPRYESKARLAAREGLIRKRSAFYGHANDMRTAQRWHAWLAAALTAALAVVIYAAAVGVL